MATATGPITIARINFTYTVGEGFLSTLQKAVSYAMNTTGYGDVIIPQGYAGTDTPAGVTIGSGSVYIIDERNGQRQPYIWNGTQYVLAPVVITGLLDATGGITTPHVTADAANFTTCNVHNSPVRTFANTPDAPQGMIWPEFGIPVSEGDHWQSPSIDPTTIAYLNQDNTFAGDISCHSLNTSGDSNFAGTVNAVVLNATNMTTTGINVLGNFYFEDAGTIGGNVTIDGTLQANSFQAIHNVLTDTLQANGITTSGLSINGNAGMTGTLTSGGLTTSGLAVNGSAGISGTLTVGELDATNGTITNLTATGMNILGAFYIQGSGTIGGNTTIGGTLTVNSMQSIYNILADSLQVNSITTSGISVNGSLGVSAGITAAAVTANNMQNSGMNVLGDMYVQGTATISNLDVAGYKNFRIPHPSKKNKELLHSALEGPEAAIFYRGEGETKNYKATVKLPDYFEALAHEDGRTVQLTAILEEDEEAFGFLAAGRVASGKFKVYSSEETQRFYWEVKAVRSDLPPLEVEQDVKPDKAKAKSK